MTIKSGDVVRLKGGSLKMAAGIISLSKISKVDEVRCYWFHPAINGLQSESIPLVVLEIVDEE